MLSTGKLNKNRDRRIYISRIIESKDDGGRLQEMQASFYVRKCRTQSSKSYGTTFYIEFRRIAYVSKR